MFLGRRRRSREESPKWICESRCCQVVFVYMYLRDVFALKPFHDCSLCSVCILHQRAFYSQSVVCILPPVRSLQSAVRSLSFTLTEKELHDHAGFSIQVNSKNFESTERLGQHVSYNDKTFSVLVNIQYSSP